MLKPKKKVLKHMWELEAALFLGSCHVFLDSSVVTWQLKCDHETKAVSESIPRDSDWAELTQAEETDGIIISSIKLNSY